VGLNLNPLLFLCLLNGDRSSSYSACLWLTFGPLLLYFYLSSLFLGGQQHGSAMCSPVTSSPDFSCMEKPSVHSLRSYGGTSCGSLPGLSITFVSG